jgi:hypothetical protein
MMGRRATVVEPLDLAALERLRALEATATPGRWESDDGAAPETSRNPFSERGASITTDRPIKGRGNVPVVVMGGAQDEQGGGVGVLLNEDAAFIVAIRNALPDLLRLARLGLEHERLEDDADAS